MSILPPIAKSATYTILDLPAIEKINGTGVYVIWDKDKSGDTPLYVGSSYYSDTSMQDIGKRVSDHIRGYTHLKKYCMFFYEIDFYVFDHSKTDPVLSQWPNKYNMSPSSLADMYEIEKIATLIPYFNGKYNNHAMQHLNRYYFKKGFHKNNHRSVVLPATTATTLGIHLDHPEYQYCFNCGIIMVNPSNTAFNPSYKCPIC